jgi:heme-degrading monooxygenase HmoA
MTVAKVKFELKNGQLDEFTARWKREVSQVENTPGLGPVLLLTQSHSNECISLAIWETAEQAVNWEKSTEFSKFKSNVRELVVSEPIREYYEVSAASSSAKSLLQGAGFRAA